MLLVPTPPNSARPTISASPSVLVLRYATSMSNWCRYSTGSNDPIRPRLNGFTLTLSIANSGSALELEELSSDDDDSLEIPLADESSEESDDIELAGEPLSELAPEESSLDGLRLIELLPFGLSLAALELDGLALDGLPLVALALVGLASAATTAGLDEGDVTLSNDELLGGVSEAPDAMLSDEYGSVLDSPVGDVVGEVVNGIAELTGSADCGAREAGLVAPGDPARGDGPCSYGFALELAYLGDDGSLLLPVSPVTGGGGCFFGGLSFGSWNNGGTTAPPPAAIDGGTPFFMTTSLPSHSLHPPGWPLHSASPPSSASATSANKRERKALNPPAKSANSSRDAL